MAPNDQFMRLRWEVLYREHTGVCGTGGTHQHIRDTLDPGWSDAESRRVPETRTCGEAST